jgi:HPt (histidine-containing phosphotransfer) domain-containing protein
MSGRVPVDRQRIDAVCRGDDSLAIELIGMLIDEAGPMVAALKEHVLRFDVNHVNELAHALKGIAGNVGAFELCDAAMRLEILSGPKRMPASNALVVEITAIAHALEHLRITQRSWITRAADSAKIFLS